MKWLIIILIAMVVYAKQVANERKSESTYHSSDGTTDEFNRRAVAEPSSNEQFKCDGRTHCSNMTSCAEATFFLRNCPGVEMDGNNDGVPCERQWCK